MKTVREIKSAIISSDLTNDDLNELVMAIRFARSQLVKEVKRSLRVGDTVKFTGRNGVTQGTLEKVAIKFATVKVGYMSWRVPMNMLESV
jgi:ABC-type Mn2+/Zn2+ transport system ATPase subunit